MKQITVTKIFTFDAAHKLPNYDGACANLHGHTYHLEVSVRGEPDLKSGMVIDFKQLDFIVGTILKDLDHSYLNDTFENPTAENLAEYLFGTIEILLKNNQQEAKVSKIKLYETPTSFVEVENIRDI
jgi:6-pyruvoyltetrahydropterin/6-carboxytetrahydropterin synthase